MPKKTRKVKRSGGKKASAPQVAAKKRLSVEAALRSLTLASSDIKVRTLFSGSAASRMLSRSGVVHDWNDKDTKDKHLRWDDDPKDAIKTLPKIEGIE